VQLAVAERTKWQQQQQQQQRGIDGAGI